MVQTYVGPNGELELDVAANTYLSVRSIGGRAEVHQQTGPGINVPSLFTFQREVLDEEVTLLYTTAKKVKILAGAATVYYQTGTTPPNAMIFWPDAPRGVHEYFNDFNTYAAAEWTITTTEAGAGSATEALTNVKGGALLVTNDDADNDADFFQLLGEPFKFESGKRLAFECRFQTNDATESDIVFGLQITDTTPLDVSDGVFFLKSDGAATVDFLVEKDGTATTESSVETLVDDTWATLGFYYDGTGPIEVFVDRNRVATVAVTNLPDDEELTVSFGIQNGAAAAKTLTVDYIHAWQDR